MAVRGAARRPISVERGVFSSWRYGYELWPLLFVKNQGPLCMMQPGVPIYLSAHWPS